MIRYAYPAWFRPWVELEEEAAAIRSLQLQLVPGLLQTEEYARAVFAGARLAVEEQEERVAARMARQLILQRDTPPELWIVLDEYVLRRPVGSSRIMRAQFERLIEAASVPSTVLQILPMSAGPAGSEGPFTVLTLDEGPGLSTPTASDRGRS